MREIDKNEAIAIAEAYLHTQMASQEYRPVLILEETIEKDYGWIFFYNSQKFLETHDLIEALLGNAPFIVEKDGGKIVIFGTAYPIKFYIENYERTSNPHGI